MALYGFCSQCGTTAWLDDAGACLAGHDRGWVNGIVDAADADPLPKTGGVMKALSGLKQPKTEAEIEARAAQDEYDARVKKACDEYKTAAAPLDRELAEARARLLEVQQIGHRRIDQLRGVVLTERSLSTPYGDIDLETETVSVAVESAGGISYTQRSTLTRIAAGSALLPPGFGAVTGAVAKKDVMHDHREVYLVVTSPRISAVIPCDPREGAVARQFAALVQTVAAGAPARAAQRDDLAPKWARHVDDVVIRRSTVLGPLRAAITAAVADTARLEAARSTK